MVLSGITDRSEKVDTATVSFGCRHLIVGFQLAATNVFSKRIVFLCFLQDNLIDHPQGGYGFRQDRFDHLLFAQSQKGTEPEHVGIEAGLRLGQFPFHLQGRQFQLHQFTFGDMADLALGNSYFIQFIGIFEVLPGDHQILIRQQEVEEIADRVDRHIFYTLDISCLRFLVADRLDTSFPFQVVHTEDRLRERQPDRYAHIFVERALPQLPVEIEG